MKIIQLASYAGNIGDNANVSGTRRVLRENFGREIQFTDLEFEWFGTDPRWARRRFDQAFIEEVNQYDLFLIGGGGFFGLTTNKTSTGTPIDIPLDTLRQIKTPMVFYALGFHTMAGHVEERAAKFKPYLEAILDMDHVLVSVRNDGSLANLRCMFGENIASRIFVCPDGGFFTQTKESTHVELEEGTRTIALQLGGDRLERRFSSPSPLWETLLRKGTERLYRIARGITPSALPTTADLFVRRLAQVFSDVLDQHTDVRVVLVPHIPSDFKMIDAFLKELGHYHARNHATVAPYLHGQEAQTYLFNLYEQCVLTVGMRFHANVCPIGRQIPSVGLVTYEQIAALYDELGLTHRALHWDDPQFETKLLAFVEESLGDTHAIRTQYQDVIQQVRVQADTFHRVIMDKFFSVP
ncbi:polysaccharide pyruvyl transferase family protein [Candidatus Uhrbacteria bacterium]|nr:polysaccharide pyruvyl transferase family protein [Candidatus Uhrbacteria bacterium]